VAGAANRFSRPRWRATLWLVLLLAATAGLQQAIAAHASQARPQPALFPAPVSDSDVPLLGVNVALEQYGDEELEATLARLVDSGFVWLRQSFHLSQVALDSGLSGWAWADRIMLALARFPSLRLVAVLDDDPPLAPADPDRFASSAAAFASRYGDQVDYYQIWDEPNLADNWSESGADAAAYADLLARAAAAIRSADPDCRILLAGLAPTVETGPSNLSDVLYLEQLYQVGAGPYFDIVAGKPYGFDTGPDDMRADDSVLNFSRLRLLREVMVRHGDERKGLWASHWGWNALPEAWGGGSSIWGEVDEATQAEYTVAALERARRQWPWLGGMVLEHFQPLRPADDPHWGFSLVTVEGESRPVLDAVSTWAASVPDAAAPGGHPAPSRWATFDGGWAVGPLGASAGADGAEVAFRFEGTAVAVTVWRGAYPGFLYASVDGEPAGELPVDESGRAYVVLYDKSPGAATVPLARGLPEGVHTLVLTVEGAAGEWVLVDWRVGSEQAGGQAVWPLIGLGVLWLGLVAALVREARRIDWPSVRAAVLGWPDWAQATLALALLGLLWWSAGVSWGRDWASPIFLVSLLCVGVATYLFALRPALGLALVALAAPFYLHPANLLEAGLSIPQVLVLLCAVGLVLRRTGSRRSVPGGTVPRSRLIDLAVLALCAVAALGALVAADRLAALSELWMVFLLPALYYALLRSARLDVQSRRWLLGGLVLGGAGVAIVGLVQYVLGRNLVIAEGGLGRLQSVYYSPNGAGLYLGRVWPLLLAGALWREGRRLVQLLRWLGVAALSGALVLTFSRGALLLALPAALLVMGFRAGGACRRRAFVLVLLLGLALVPLLQVPRFASLLDLEQGSSFFRLELWRSTLSMIGDHPWLGVGPGNFLQAYRTRYALPSAWQELNQGHAHNMVLDYLVRTGPLGLLAGLAAQLGFWRALSRSGPDRALALGLAGSMAALLAHGLVDNSLFFPDLALCFSAMLALAQAAGPAGLRPPAPSKGVAGA
jgi:O-antigen ligase